MQNKIIYRIKLNIQSRFRFVRSSLHKLYWFGSLFFLVQSVKKMRVHEITRTSITGTGINVGRSVEIAPTLSEQETHLKQVEKAAEYYLKTHPNFEINFTICSSPIRYFDNDGPRIGFIQGRWTNALANYTYLSNEIITAVKSKVLRIGNTIQQSSYRPPKTTEYTQERNHFFWALIDLVLIMDTTNYLGQEFTENDIRSTTFLSLELEETAWTRDVNKLLDCLKLSDLSKLERRIMELFDLPVLNWLKSSDSNSVPQKRSAIDIYQSIDVEKTEKTTLRRKLESMFLRVPCRPLIDIFSATLPFDFLIEYGDRKLWRMEAEKIFAPQLRQLTDLITPLIFNVFGYLWDEISAEQMAQFEAQILADYQLELKETMRLEAKIMEDYNLRLQQMRFGMVNNDYYGLQHFTNPVPFTALDTELLHIMVSDETETVQKREKREKSEKREKHKSNQQQQQRQQQKSSRHPRHKASNKYDHSRANFSGR